MTLYSLGIEPESRERHSHHSLPSHCTDNYGDGIKEPGSYTITFNGSVLKTGNDFGFNQTTTFVVGIPVDDRPPSWSSVLYEDFGDGLGNFVTGGFDATYIPSRFERSGLIMIKHGIDNYDEASINSGSIPLDDRDGFTRFKVTFSFYASNIGPDDGFCLDYRANEVSAWTQADCWPSGDDVENGKWNDDVAWEFQTGFATSIDIRFRGFSADKMRRVFIDKIHLFGSI